MIEKAKHLAAAALITDLRNHGIHDVASKIKQEDMYVVWFCKTLQNWKALVSTDTTDGVYIEVTHNGNKGETYVDVYTKSANICYTD